MNQSRNERRLTTILAADIVGYSRLMELDETGTLTLMKQRRKELLEPLLTKYAGRLVKLMGDGVLVEFASVVNAVECAVELQNGMADANAGLPNDRQLQLRVGINLGDVIVDGGDLYGDGVNLAARLETMAEPGGICISEIIYHQVRKRLNLAYVDLGSQSVKNIAEPVRAYSIGDSNKPLAAGQPISGRGKTAIVVLPFTNISGDSEQEYFSDGITEDIITDLSQVSALFVVARHTAFSFKGKNLQLPQVARELGVGYVLEGSVRKAGDRVRITAQLIDGATGGHLWANRYDRELKDIFALQDEISTSIVGALKIKLAPSKSSALAKRTTENPEAYRRFLLGRSFLMSGADLRAYRVARQMFAQAVELDPAYALAYVGMASAESYLLMLSDPEASLETTLANCSKALALQSDLAEAHAALGQALSTAGRVDEATAAFERALKLNPELFETYLFYGRLCVMTGQHEKAAWLLARAAESQSNDYIALGLLASECHRLGRDDEAQQAAERCIERIETEIRARPDNAGALAFGASVLAGLGHKDRAEEWAANAVVINPDDYRLRYNVACTYAIIGDIDVAMEHLERATLGTALAQRYQARWLKHDADLDSLRENPKFKALAARLAFMFPPES
ncbi:MAG: adenylate/guanylate cyclase domain-containing protein [Dongiaceae bacterium]